MKLLLDLYKISSPSDKEKAMIEFITNKLTEMSISYTIDKAGNIYARKGQSETYPCLVAHTDEVHGKRNSDYEVVAFRNEIVFGYDKKKGSLVGIGADDKNGIWVCLKALQEFDVIKCAFFTGEEIGCMGSNRADMAFFDDCRFVVQCDRKGRGDLVTSIANTKLCSKEFIKDINPENFGYAKTQGLQTDVATLKQRGLEVSCVNISCGYYNPHTNEEYTNIADLENCYNFVRYIINTCTEAYPHKHSHIRDNWYHSYGRELYCGYPGYSIFDNNDRPGRRNPTHEAEYNSMMDDMFNMLVHDDTLSIEDLILNLQTDYPRLTRYDFQKAYSKIM